MVNTRKEVIKLKKIIAAVLLTLVLALGITLAAGGNGKNLCPDPITFLRWCAL